MTTAEFFITLLAYLVTGALPPMIAVYLIRVRFLGGIVVSTLVGVIAAVIGGLVDTVLLRTIPDLLVIGGTVDIVPPFIASIVVTAVFGLVSSTNG